jgi:GNAT superfamily N-acetyltransferase
MSDAILITSRLGAERRSELEQLLFFNEQQEAVRGRLEEIIEQFGVPQVVLRDQLLRVEVGDLSGVQGLFAVRSDGQPVGCALFHRAAEDRFVVIHLVVDPAYSGRGQRGDTNVLMRLLGAVRQAARRTRGVSSIELLYPSGRTRRLPV